MKDVTCEDQDRALSAEWQKQERTGEETDENKESLAARHDQHVPPHLSCAPGIYAATHVAAAGLPVKKVHLASLRLVREKRKKRSMKALMQFRGKGKMSMKEVAGL